MITVIEWGSELLETPSVFVGPREAGAVWAAAQICRTHIPDTFAPDLAEFDIQALHDGVADPGHAAAFIAAAWDCTTDAWVGFYFPPVTPGEATFDGTP